MSSTSTSLLGADPVAPSEDRFLVFRPVTERSPSIRNVFKGPELDQDQQLLYWSRRVSVLLDVFNGVWTILSSEMLLIDGLRWGGEGGASPPKRHILIR